MGQGAATGSIMLARSPTRSNEIGEGWPCFLGTRRHPSREGSNGSTTSLAGSSRRSSSCATISNASGRPRGGGMASARRRRDAARPAAGRGDAGNSPAAGPSVSGWGPSPAGPPGWATSGRGIGRGPSFRRALHGASRVVGGRVQPPLGPSSRWALHGASRRPLHRANGPYTVQAGLGAGESGPTLGRTTGATDSRSAGHGSRGRGEGTPTARLGGGVAGDGAAVGGRARR